MYRSKEERLKIVAGGRIIHADLLLPPVPEGIVVFSHFYQSEPAERRHRLIAEVLNKYNIAALLFDLTPEGKGPDPSALSSYTGVLCTVVDNIQRNPAVANKPVAIMSSSNGIVPAFSCALSNPRIRAIVSRGPVPVVPRDIASAVKIPVLLLAGAKDPVGVQSNLRIYENLADERDLKIISGASSNFHELGKLGEVAHLSANWFTRNLTGNKAVPA